MQRPGFLNTDSIGILPDGKGGAVASALLLQDNALKYLDSFLLAFLDLCVNPYGITNAELRDFGLQLLFFDLFNDLVHRFNPPVLRMFLMHTILQQRTISFFTRRKLYHVFPAVTRGKFIHCAIRT